MKTITILDTNHSTVYHYNITSAQIGDIEIFLEDKGINLNNAQYMISDTLMTFDNRTIVDYDENNKQLLISLSNFIQQSGLDMIDEVNCAKRLFKKLENK